MKRKFFAMILTLAMLLSTATVMPAVTASETKPPYSCGDVDGNGVITITDALEVLKFLANVQPNISDNPQAMNAARVIEGRIKGENPVIGDVLEILKLLANINSVFDGFNCPDCDWCNEEDEPEVTTTDEVVDTTPETVTEPTTTNATTTTLQTTTTVTMTLQTTTTVATTTTLQTTTTLTTTTLTSTLTPPPTQTTTTAGAFMVSFNLNYAGAPTPPAAVAVRDNGTISSTVIPTVSRAGYTFNGWFTAETGGTRIVGGGSGTQFTASTTVYAQWTAAAATTTTVTTTSTTTSNTQNPGAIELIFDLNYSGAPSPTRRTLDSQGSIMTPMPYPTRSGNWVFGGWFTDRDQATAVSNPPSRGNSVTSTMTGRSGTVTSSRVIPGAAGNTFRSTTTVYAGWIPVTPIEVINNVTGIVVRGGDGNGLNPAANRTVTANRIVGIPQAFQENFDWLRFIRHNVGTPGNDGTGGRPELVWFEPNGNLRFRNSVFDQIWEGNGTINWAVRWESGRTITRAERENMARMLHESVNVWSRELIGMPGWPFGEIEVHVVGYAMTADRMADRRPNETLWINNTHEAPNGIHPGENRMASAPRAMSRFIHFGPGRPNATYNYPGGLHNRFDMYQWVTQGFGGAVGGDWGNRLGDTRVIGYGRGVNAQGVNTLNGVQTHEVGHSYGFYDLYGTRGRIPPPTSVPCPGGATAFRSGQLRTVMDGTYAGPLNNYDVWKVRYHWEWLYSQRIAINRPFARPTQPFVQ